MAHVIVQDLGNGYIKLVPEPGYILLNERTQQNYRQAVVKNTRPFRAVEL